YTDFKNGLMGGDVVSSVLLPFDRDDFRLDPEETAELKKNYQEYMPNVATVLNNIIPSYLAGYIYSALVDSFCSEQSARMSAMDAANQNAEELLDKLNLEYNHVRQSAITQEITEVSAGSRGQKKSKKKREEREEGLN
ncbi:MAG: F0F1 ATP synthase subunit gamma, partial [Firmicutes bacterium]|nr:F0F1 ATP synthase subunit gamma [Bacillota bacterium]